jgi:hypothetical protein
MSFKPRQAMGMSIDIWGPAAWSFLHSATFNYGKNPEKATVEEQEQARAFFISLPHMLPCSICRKHYLQHIEKNPPQVESRDALTRWLVKIHNIVNIANHKPIIPYEHVREHYLGGRQWLSPATPEEEDPEMCSLRTRAQMNEYLVYGLIAVIVGLVVYYAIVMRRKKS